jgi:hypothetical protein
MYTLHVSLTVLAAATLLAAAGSESPRTLAKRSGVSAQAALASAEPQLRLSDLAHPRCEAVIA